MKGPGILLAIAKTTNTGINAHTLTWYQSLRVKGSKVFFLRPFFPFERRLFLSSCQTLHLEFVAPPFCHRASCFYRPNRIQRSIKEGYSLSDSHDCDKLPSRGAVVVKVGCRRSLRLNTKFLTCKWVVGGRPLV